MFRFLVSHQKGFRLRERFLFARTHSKAVRFYCKPIENPIVRTGMKDASAKNKK